MPASATIAAFAFARCGGGGCDEDPSSLLSVENVLQCQKVSDFLISLGYFSISLELFYFVTCAAIFPFRWVLLQFGAFIVLCGLTHLATTFTYSSHSFHLVLLLTIFKFLTALVSIATAVTLFTVIPQLLRTFVREGLLRQKARDLNREVGLMKRQEEARWHVGMLTRDIRRSLDRRTILDTALVELSRVLFLGHCAVWMAEPSDPDTMILTHEINPRRSSPVPAAAISIDDPDVVEIVKRKGVVILGPESSLVRGGEEASAIGSAAAIRMPVLRVSDFNGGGGVSPEILNSSDAILVLGLPAGGDREWTSQQLEIVEVVADQVAVALSHAAMLEESLVMREELLERNMMLKRAQEEAVMANDARVLFRKVMTREITAPLRSVSAVFSALQLEDLRPEQLALVKEGLVLSSLIDGVVDVSGSQEWKLELKLLPFGLQEMMEETFRISKLWCSCHGSPFVYQVFGNITRCVVGDERRILQAVLYMVAYVLGSGDQGAVNLHVHVEEGSQGAWKQNFLEEFVKLRFEVSVTGNHGECNTGFEVFDAEVRKEGLSLSVCKQLAQLMNGDVSVISTSQGLKKNVNLLIRLQCQRLEEGIARQRFPYSESTLSLLKGMRILLGDIDGLNRSIARGVLQKFGCHLVVASSWYECLETLYIKGDKFHLLLIDLHILQNEGHDIPAQMRKLRSESWLLIVGLVSKANRDTWEQCLQTGLHGVIGKPIILQEMVGELLRITQQLQSPATLH